MMDNQVLLPIDKISIAVHFSEALCRKATQLGTADAEVVLRILTSIFPWLGRFSIVKDGSLLRWKCVDSVNDDRAVVYARPTLAEQQIRDWVLEQIEKIATPVVIERMTAK